MIDVLVTSRQETSRDSALGILASLRRKQISFSCLMQASSIKNIIIIVSILIRNPPVCSILPSFTSSHITFPLYREVDA